MTKFERQIFEAVRDGRWSLSVHADERLAERFVESWQIWDSFAGGQNISVEPHSRPNPKILRRQMLADGTEVVVVWSNEKSNRVAKVVTVYYESA